MTHRIDPVDHYIEGDSLVIPFNTLDGDSDQRERKPLDGAEISWKLKDGQYADTALLSDDHSEVVIEVTNAEKGEFEVHIGTDVTSDLSGNHVQIVEIIDKDGYKSTAVGDFDITGIART